MKYNDSRVELALKKSILFLESAAAIRCIDANVYWPKWNFPGYANGFCAISCQTVGLIAIRQHILRIRRRVRW